MKSTKTLKIVIVGGVAGGMSAAARLRRQSEEAEIVVFERGEAVSFANCGLPYYIGDVIQDRAELLLQTPASLKARFNIDVKIRHEVVSIDRNRKSVSVRDLASGKVFEEHYDKLVLSPGAEALRPPIPGLNSSRVFTLRNMSDTDAIKKFVTERRLKNAVVIGAGFIGLEMAENLCHLGARVSVIEALPQVMNVVDPEIAATVALHMREKGVELFLSQSVVSVRDNVDGLEITLSSGKTLQTEMAILSIGVKPESQLAKLAGLAIGDRGGILVNEFLQTSDEHIYAAGDAVETKNMVTGKVGITPLAGPANKQGRLIADNIAFGNVRKFRGTIGTGIAKVFDLSVGSTGANEKTLGAAGIPFESVLIHPASHAGYYPGAQTITIKMLFSPVDGCILGAQAVGQEGVDRRLDVLALAVHKGLTVADLEEYEHVYAPPFSGAKDPVNLAAYVAINVLSGRLNTLTLVDFEKIDRNTVTVVDVRTRGEFEAGSILGALNIPVDKLRERLSQIPTGKPVIVFCAVGLRAYVSARILMQSGFSNVRSLSGGYYSYAQIERMKIV